MGLGEPVLVEEDRTAPHLADDQVETAVVAEVPGDHRAAVAVVIGARHIAHVEETLAADVEVRALAP